MNPTIRFMATLALAIAPFACGARAEAQYGGFGGFGGFGWGYNQNAYTDVNYLNSRANTLAGIAGAHTPQPLQAPQFQTRDDSIYDKYDLSTRESMINRIAADPDREMGTADPSGVLPSRPRRTTSTARAPAAPAGPSEPTSVHLANFFNKDQVLIWPSSAPISGELGKKQTVADLAALAVLNEYDMKGLARVSTVTDARQKLLNYGRPALQQVKEQSTPALADSFHVFLLSLYGNLGAAATVPKAQ
jgi:hypothetical protein